MKSTKPYWNTLILPTLLLVFGSACTKTSNELENGKARLENEIRGQVKFLEEQENLSSIKDKMVDYKIPALSLAVISQGKIAWTETYQNENFEQQPKLDCTSIFQAASLSKPVTFLAALRMHAEGKIDLDKNIQEYLKEFVLPAGQQTPDNPVTFRNIFSHTSGISPGGYQGYERTHEMPTDLNVLRGSTGVNTSPIEVVSAPNEMLAYSGGGYTLAELALQDIFKDEFSNIMKEWILEPARMKNAEFTQPLPESEIHRVAKGYSQSGDLIEGGWRNHPEQAAAGLWSNSTDLAKFLIEIYNAYQGHSSIFSASDIKTILSHERDGHVYGFIVNRSENDISLTHYGGNVGYRTGMTISLTSGNGLVYLINSDNGGALGNELLLSASQIYDWQHFKQTEAKRKPIDSSVLKELSGKYKWNDQVDLSIAFNEDKNQISLFFPNGDEYELVPIVGDELGFIHGNTGIQVSFTNDAEKPSFMLYGQAAVKL
ncbi:CubicO group peptidase, beta-lactamase class C family [Algoriphagus faecimaris]|uniref:CubicO group peptidase, beta-lactamase class C family n=1 Tax=Algoriphagus faecimaris TaxID=686796 RepID=A0A1G6N8Y2_9BACT|nr:serine hydrolase domain-containing protein [Algoriphagus faecimaris]SDC64310.1 CubicO group peptidase, beta-lactamase class C family [Algoriphagus faecimaris]